MNIKITSQQNTNGLQQIKKKKRIKNKRSENF